MEKKTDGNRKNENENLRCNGLNRYYYVRIGLLDESDDFEDNVVDTVKTLFRTLGEIAKKQKVTIETWNALEDDERKRIV